MATEFLDAVRSAIGTENLVPSCGGEGCGVDMAGVPTPRVIVDADRTCRSHRIEGGRCDRVLFVIGDAPPCPLALPIELKSGHVDASEVARQLRRGVDLVNRFAPPDARLRCRPLLIHGRGLHRKQRKKLSREKIRFRGQDLTIETTRCGRPRNLARALSLQSASR